MRVRSIAARTSFAAFVLAALIALVASFGTRLGLWDYKIGISLIWPAAGVGVIALIAGLFWATLALMSGSGEGARYGAVGLLGAIIVVGIPLDHLRLRLVSPPIHDISTDVGNAPAFKAIIPLRKGAENGPDYDGPKLIRLPDGKLETEAALQKKYYGDVIPFAGFGKPQKLFWRALNLANSMGWQVVAFDPKEGRIEATATSFWFGFKDDIVIRVRPAGKLGARLDIRSKSRVGVSDLGSNAARLHTFLKRLKAMG